MPNRDPEKQRAAWRKWYHENKSDQLKKIYFNRKARRKKALEWLAAYKKTICCSSCGFNGHPAALDFHHAGTDKVFEIGNWFNITCSIPRIRREIEKCTVLCANCHRIQHAEEREQNKMTA